MKRKQLSPNQNFIIEKVDTQYLRRFCLVWIYENNTVKENL